MKQPFSDIQQPKHSTISYWTKAKTTLRNVDKARNTTKILPEILALMARPAISYRTRSKTMLRNANKARNMTKILPEISALRAGPVSRSV